VTTEEAFGKTSLHLANSLLVVISSGRWR
jgi:hypothetical protein